MPVKIEITVTEKLKTIDTEMSFTGFMVTRNEAKRLARFKRLITTAQLEINEECRILEEFDKSSGNENDVNDEAKMVAGTDL